MTPEEYEVSIMDELQHFEPRQRLGRLVLMREKVVKTRIDALLVAERHSKEINLLENMIDREGDIEEDDKRRRE